jgi:hypothetical protein
MKYWWLLCAVVTLGACRPEASPPPPVASAADSTGRPTAEIVISGDVAATITDASNRRSGWEGHKFSDIPGCSVDVVPESEVAEPGYYLFRWDAEVAGTFRLSLRPRTDGDVSLTVRAASSAGTKCEKVATTNLEAEAEKSWTVRIEATNSRCAADLIRNDGK